MVTGFGWGDVQVRWLLSQLGVPDELTIHKSSGDMVSKEAKAVEAVVQRQLELGLAPVQKDVAALQVQLEAQNQLLTKLVQQVAS